MIKTILLGPVFLCLVSLGVLASDLDSQPYTTRALVTTSNWAVLSSEILAPIASLPLRPGEHFKKGDILVTFDCATYSAQRDAYAADERQAMAQWQSQKRLLELGSAGQLDVSMAQASLDRARATLQLQDVYLQRCQLRAPYDGIVVRWGAQPYQTVAAGDEVIEIVGAQSLELELIAPSSWLSWLKIGQSLTAIIDETGETVEAKVIRLGARIDPVSQTINIYAAITKGDSKLLPGMSGKARVMR